MKFRFALYCVIIFWKSIDCKMGLLNYDLASDGYIVGGHIVSIKNYPYMAQLTFHGQFYCGSSIISRSWILTAAHCTFKATVDALKIRVGSDVLHEKGVVIDIKQIREHRKYDRHNLDYDVALLELKKRISYNDLVKPIKLARINDFPEPESIAEVAGWGRRDQNDKLMSSQLRAVSVPLIDSDVCQDWYSKRFIIKQFVICAGYEEGGKDSCNGDSGGPLVFEGKQIGIVSKGFGCAQPLAPGIYTAVAHPSIRRFIKKTTGL